MRRRGQGTAQLPVYDDGVEHRELAEVQDARLAQLQPELLGVPDGVVLELAHDIEAGMAGAQAAHRLP